MADDECPTCGLSEAACLEHMLRFDWPCCHQCTGHRPAPDCDTPDDN